MMDNNIFRRLTAGTCFKRTRFSKDVHLTKFSAVAAYPTPSSLVSSVDKPPNLNTKTKSGDATALPLSADTIIPASRNSSASAELVEQRLTGQFNLHSSTRKGSSSIAPLTKEIKTGTIGKNSRKSSHSEVLFEESQHLRRLNRIHLYPKGSEHLFPPPLANFDDLLDISFNISSDVSIKNNEDSTKNSSKTIKQKRKRASDLASNEETLSSGASTVPPSWLIENVKAKLNLHRLTPIQMQVIPLLLAGHTVVGCAPTGSGKTLAYLIPLFSHLKTPCKAFARSLILCPTRELAQQIFRVMERLRGKKKFRGKVLDKLSRTHQNDSVMRLDIAISTPLRLVQLCRDQLIQLSSCKYLILDEADKLLDMGFAPQIDEILTYMEHPSLNLSLFSATMSDSVLQLADSVAHSPLRVSIGAPNAAAETIEQSLLFVTNEEGKLDAFRQLLADGKVVPPTLVFVDRKDRAQQLFNELIYDGIFVDVIHAERTKAQRDAIVASFRAGKTWILICTDLMARGLDFKGVDTVINFDFPHSSAHYIHRIGRTGRAGRNGVAITFYTLDDISSLPIVVNVMRQSGCTLPEWLLKTIATRKKDRHRSKPMKRARISTVSSYDLQRQAKKRQMIQSKKEATGHSTPAILPSNKKEK